MADQAIRRRTALARELGEQPRAVVVARRDLARAGVSQELELITFYSLRAFFTAHLMRIGTNPKEFQEIARHKDPRTTLKHYLRTDPDHLRRLADRLPPPSAEG